VFSFDQILWLLLPTLPHILGSFLERAGYFLGGTPWRIQIKTLGPKISPVSINSVFNFPLDSNLYIAKLVPKKKSQISWVKKLRDPLASRKSEPYL